jgi:hypothetical protein
MDSQNDHESITSQLDVQSQHALLSELATELAREGSTGIPCAIKVDGRSNPIPVAQLLRGLERIDLRVKTDSSE